MHAQMAAQRVVHHFVEASDLPRCQPVHGGEGDVQVGDEFVDGLPLMFSPDGLADLLGLH